MTRPSYGVSSLEFMVVAQAGLAGAALNQGWKAAIGPRGLDERQRQLRDRAAYLSYRIVLVTVVLATVMLYALVLLFPFNSWGPITLDSTGLIALATCILVLCFCLNVLPMAVVAWLEPDQPSEV